MANGGTLQIGNNSALGTGTFTVTSTAAVQATGGARAIANNVVWGGNGTISGSNGLTINGTFTSSGSSSRSLTVSNTGGLIINGNVFLAPDNTTARGLTITGTTDATINGVIANNNAGNTLASTFTKSGTNLVVLTNANTYTGATTISGGTLQLGNGGTTGSLSPSSAISIGSTGTLRFDRTSGADFVQGTDFSSSAITGAGQVIKDGTNSLTFNVANTFSGGLTINKGTVVGTVDGALGAGNISLTAGNITLSLNGASNNIADSATLSYVGTDLIILNNTTTDTVAGLVVDGVAQAPGVYGATATNPDGAFLGAGTITVTAVPEPTTIGMLLLGGGLLSAVQRFRRKQS
jgi:autotransporter-associated beta strand protein